MDNQSYITFPVFDKFPEIICAFSTRIDGHSIGKYSSLNIGLSTGDDRETVLKNRSKFYERFELNENQIAIPGQTHSTNVKYAEKGGNYSNADALYTNKTNIYLTVQTADCFPVFIYDPIEKVIAVVHAGWQGAVKNILTITLNKIRNDYNVKYENLNVAIGPGIQPTCFEVKKDVFSKFPTIFLKEHPDKSKRYLDLNAFLFAQLIDYGVKTTNIFSDKTCTHCDSKRFYSYRRSGKKSGRMMGIIGMRNQSNWEL